LSTTTIIISSVIGCVVVISLISLFVYKQLNMKDNYNQLRKSNALA
jgi:hypothetical protein